MASSSTISAYNTNTNTGPSLGLGLISGAQTQEDTYPTFMGTLGGPTIRAATRAALTRMLALDASTSTDAAASSSSSAPSTAPIVWKVLILDQTARDILSPLLSVADLRDAGVTVHMSLHSPRQPIPDVPAVYFCDPTQAAIVRIAEDMAANLYDAFHLNFTSPLPRALLEDLAQRLVATGCAHLVAKVVDQYLPLRVLDQHLVSLALPQALVTLHSPTTPESELMALLDTCATGLLGVCITLGVVPYIRFSTAPGPAEMIARRLESKLRDVMHAQLGPGKVPVIDPEAPRPVVLILDRTLDLGTPVAHSWLYAPLIVDVLEWKLNRVTCLVDEGPATQKVKKTFDIDVGKDSFWRASAGMPFPEVADMVDRDLAKYKRDAQEVLSATGAKSLEEMGQMDVGLNAKHLKSALTQLPALTARKRTLDAHMHIATALLSAIQARKLDTLYEVEQKPTKVSVLDALRDQVTSARDAARLAIVFINHVMHPSAAGATAGQVQQITDDVDEVIKQVAAKYPDAQVELDAIKYVKSLRALGLSSTLAGSGPSSLASATGASAASAAASAAQEHLFGRFAGRLTETLAQATQSGSLGGAVESLVGGVKSLVLSGRGPYAAKRVEAVLDGVEEQGMATIDVRVAPSRAGAGAGARSPAPVRSGTPGLGGSGGASGAGAAGCIVFVVGGGSMLEYRQVLDVAKSRKRPVVYVGTEMGRPEDVVEMLGQLGRAGRS